MSVSSATLENHTPAKFRLEPHRIALIAVAIALFAAAVIFGRWDWLPRYLPRLGSSILVTLFMLFGSAILGFLLALPLGLAQTAGPWWLNWPAKAFCTVIRGTPLLLQLWLLYYGLGSLFPSIPGIRSSFLWPYLREAWPYGLTALTISFAAYEGEVMRALSQVFRLENYRPVVLLACRHGRCFAASGCRAPFTAPCPR